MIRVYFRTGRNTIKSRLYDANSATTWGTHTLTVSRIETKRTKVSNFWFWTKEVTKEVRYNLAVFASGEWMRWEYEEPKKEEKHVPRVQSEDSQDPVQS